MLKKSINRLILGGSLIALLTCTAYIPAMRGGYIWDDDLHVTDNMTLRSFAGLRSIWFEFGAIPQYYPLVHTSFWINYQAGALNPVGYHLVNVVLHAMSAVFLWVVLKQLSIPGAWFAAAVFALHPVHVESVAWISERKNVLSAFFYLSSLLSYLHFYFPGSRLFENKPASQSDTVKKNRNYYILSLFLFTCALLSKTVTASLPAVILVIIWWKRNSIRKRDVKELIPFFIAGVFFGLVTVLMEKMIVGAKGEEWSYSVIERCLIAGRTLWFYAGKLFLPLRLTFIYPRWNIDPGIWWQYMFPLSALAVIGSLWMMRGRIGRGPLAGVLIFAGTLFPALGFIDVYPMRFSFVADHFQYLASIGLITLSVSGLTQFFINRGFYKKHLEYAVYGTLLVALWLLVWNRGAVYKNSEILWRDTLVKNPTSWIALTNMGAILIDRGELDEAYALNSEALEHKPGFAEAHYNLGIICERREMLDEAVEHYTEALRLNPGFFKVYNSLAVVLERQSNYEEAITNYTEALRINPNFAEAHNGLAIVLARQGINEEALLHYNEALRLKPDFAQAHNNMGVLFFKQGRLDEALTHYTEALHLKPDFIEAYFNLGKIHENRGEFEDALGNYTSALRLKPDFAEAYFAIGNILGHQGRFDEAISNYTEALILKPENPDTHNNLAKVLYQKGNTVNSLEHFKEAVRLNPRHLDALNNLAWILATHENPELRDGLEAVRLARQSCELTEYKNPLLLDTLAAAFAEAGNFNEAIKTVQSALSIIESSDQQSLSESIEKRLRLYENNLPYHEISQ
ncbi:tetratricopeptide repeat protein [Candidatus Latescibacterota bacterium]